MKSSDNQFSETGYNIRILEIGSFSFAALCALVFSIYGLLSGLKASYVLLNAAADRQTPLTASYVVKDMLFAGAAGFIFWLVIGFSVGGTVAGTYNMIAKQTGGVRLRIRQE